MSLFRACILTLFPEMFPGSLQFSLAGQALKKNIWAYDLINIRDFGLTKHKNIDDEPFGGGNGLIMRADVLGNALDHALSLKPHAKIYYMSPRGKLLNQTLVKEIVTNKDIIFLCGRYEGIDERVIDEYSIVEISIGDYILSGGEIAVIATLDACVRLLPGVLANRSTLSSESFEQQQILPDGRAGQLLEYPLYTRPSIWRERKVPDVLLSGHHKKIEDWQYEQSLSITMKRRPDLLK